MPLGSWYSQLPAFGWFDPEDRPRSNALGVPDSQQGIALPTRRGLGKWFLVTPPGQNQPFPLQQTDTGPAPDTGRGVDISAAGAHQMGYNPKNFPTDANFKVEPIDTTGLGLAAGYMGGVPGVNDTAVAEGPSQQRRRTMPNSLMDMFQSRDPAGEPSSFADNLQARSNSLIGLGLGLLQPSNPLRGQSSWGNALEGFQGGAALDARTAAEAARLRHQKSQDARQAAMDRFNMGMREKEFTQGALTPYQKMEADIARAKGTPNEQMVDDFYRKQRDAGPPETREVFDPALGRNVVQEWDSRSKSYKTATMGGGTTGTAPADPFAAGAGRPVYGEGGDYSSRSAPAATGTQGQPVLPAKKPLTAHEQTAIDDADKAVIANRGVVGTLQDAKRLSKSAFSGLFPMQRAEVSANIPDSPLLPGSNQSAKDTLLLHNSVISQAVDQLKATFGGNPSEGERKILLDLAGSMTAPDDVRQEIYDRAIKAANARLELNQRRAQEIRGGTYYTPGGEKAATSSTSTAPTTGNPLDEARHAIRMGAPRAAVIERLAKSGIRFNPKDLD